MEKKTEYTIKKANNGFILEVNDGDTFIFEKFEEMIAWLKQMIT